MELHIPNPFYEALTTSNADVAVHNSGKAFRYQRDIIPFAAIAEPTMSAMDDLAALLNLGEKIFLLGETFPDVPKLHLAAILPGLQMHHAGTTLEADDSDSIIESLTLAHADEMVSLKAVAFPGYFNHRAVTLGDFFGIRDAVTGQLIAMAGERLSLPDTREISALCVHPDHRGRGHGERLMRAVMRAQAARGTRSFLHVLSDNTRAIALYEAMGFQTTGTVTFQQFERVS